MSSAPLDAAGFAHLTGVSRETLYRFKAYISILNEWSARMNLVSRTTLDDVWRRHLLDSAQLAPLIPKDAKSLVDLGSGAGLPGLVLAILGVPGVELVESDSRKCAFLGEAARITGTEIVIHNQRVEMVVPHIVDVITARACAPLDRLLNLAEPFIGAQTVCLFLKGARVEEELTVVGKAWTMSASRHSSLADPAGTVLVLQQVVRELNRA